MQCGSSSVGRASASQAEGREFEPRLPLRKKTGSRLIARLPVFFYNFRMTNECPEVSPESVKRAFFPSLKDRA